MVHVFFGKVSFQINLAKIILMHCMPFGYDNAFFTIPRHDFAAKEHKNDVHLYGDERIACLRMRGPVLSLESIVK